MGMMEWWAIITIAFVGSFGHCIGMCGGFIIAYSSAKIDNTMSKKSQLMRHGAYNIGRVSSYVVIGMIFGFIGSVIALSMSFHGILFIVAGVVMIITGLGMLGVSKLIHLLESSVMKMPWFKTLFARLIKSKSISSFFALGMMNGFFPCGFVFFFAAKAAASASMIDGGLIMAVFGLATVPTLLAIGQSVSLLQKLEFRQIMNKIAAIAILIYGIYSIYYGLAYFYDLPL
jgi:sulfite exporter TauE/SafE